MRKYFNSMFLAAVVMLVAGCMTFRQGPGPRSLCPKPDDYYRMSLEGGDVFNITLHSRIVINTPNGTKIDIPVNNIRNMYLDPKGNASVYFCDGVDVSGKLSNKTLSVLLAATNKMETIDTSIITQISNIGIYEREPAPEPPPEESQPASIYDDRPATNFGSKEY